MLSSEHLPEVSSAYFGKPLKVSIDTEISSVLSSSTYVWQETDKY